MLNQEDSCSRSGNLALAFAAFLIVRAAVGAERPADPQFWQDVAASNAATWSAIFSLDVEYQTTVRAVENGQVLFERTSTGHRWMRLPDRQRLVLRDLDGRGRLVDRLIREGRQYRLEYPITLDLAAQPLRLCDDRPLNATILASPPDLIDELVPQNLEQLYFLRAAPRMTLQELLAGRESQLTTPSSGDDGDLATLRVDLRPRDDATSAESFVVLTVDVGKGCLIQKAEMVEAGAAQSAVDGSPVPIRTVWEVRTWAQPDAGVWYPTEVTFVNHGRADVPPSGDGYYIRWTITHLAVNQPVADDEWLGFSFPENAVVQEHPPDGSPGRILVWGPGNHPQVEFETEAEYEVFRRAACNDSATTRNEDAAASAPSADFPASSRSIHWRWILLVQAVVLAVWAIRWGLRRRQ